MNYQKQMKLKDNPHMAAIEELINPKIDELDWIEWLKKKRKIGKKKFNKPISRNKRRIAIRKKQLGLR
jgi:hypothetical protein